MLDKTREQVNDTEDVRYISFAYFWEESTANPIVFLFGHGPLTGTEVGKQLSYLEKEYGLYISDVGIVGILYNYGAIYCILLLLCYIFFLYKVRKIPWILAYQFPILLFVVLIPVLHSPISMFFFAIIMYLADIELIRKDGRPSCVMINKLKKKQ